MNREAYFDNARWGLIFLVVFGHVIQPYIDQEPFLNVIYFWIYTFHMPAFIFMAGYFAKGTLSKGYVIYLMKKLLVPYAVFQIVYTFYYLLIGKEDWLHSPFEPHWSLWFLISLFCWHLLLYWYKSLPKHLALLIALQIGLLVGYMDEIGHLFSLSRTFVFFPFFLLGYWFNDNHLSFLRQRASRAVALVVMVSMAVGIAVAPPFSIDWFLSSKSYAVMGASEWGGMFRLVVYSISTVMMLSVLAWVPARAYSWSKYGQRTLYVYLMHGFFVQWFREYNVFHVDSVLDIILLFIISGLITWLLASWKMIQLSQPLIEMYKYIPSDKQRAYYS
ncbi:acyltransferase family protein [Pontibacillus litoralis]|uniref:Acyltransferase 3 domain-containing protein n=1 Tax=Pontibacillus litoralis JSM 072002 TaxID=1385512 RepID=A0A0A5G541_9BACI|nr:acyltransferase family protein [Pontibacillus litoralis]KGX87164.1 hypothetical protein N784_16070 [Pontibacillus litoralis JSM 072002]